LPFLVIDALARAAGKRYSTLDVVGAGPRIVAGILEEFEDTLLLPYEAVVNKINIVRDFNAFFISAMSSDYVALRKIALELRTLSNAPIILGGPVSFEYERVLRELPVDYVIVGEAEIPLRHFMRCLKSGETSECLEKTPALAFRKESKVTLTSRHVYTPKELLSEIKPWSKVNVSYKPTWVYRFYVEVLRGCSNYFRPLINRGGLNCTFCMKCRSSNLTDRINCPSEIPPGCGFCGVPYMFGPPRSRSIRSIISEIEELVNHGARRIVLSAPDFLDYGREDLVDTALTDPCIPPANKDAIESLLNSVFSIDEVKSGKVAVMVENIKACLVDEEVGKILGTYLKGTTVHIGLETGCDWYNNKVLGKPVSVKHVLQACNILKNAGLRPYVYLMYGLPFATREVYLETMRAVRALSEIGVEKITLYKYTKLPATAFSKLKDIEAHEVSNDLIRELKKLIDKYNVAMKRSLIGNKIEVYLVKGERSVYCYPVKHGPVVVIPPKYTPSGKINGCRGIVEVVDISSRFVQGRLIRVLECPRDS
jgi:radical SAM superfamily enzyme YgiQ (UPF0313 family)